MARLFITTREIDFISDLTKEITKDVIGQSIYYYRVREDISEVHEVYEESLEKIFDPPIEIETRVMWNPQDIKTDRFGLEATSQIEVYVHYRDMIDKGISLLEGDYFSFGADFFEITSIKYDKIIFGQVEHISGYTIMGKQARLGQINIKNPLGPTEEIYTDANSVQRSFEQQRGQPKNSIGETNDKRALIDNGTLDNPISQPQKIISGSINSYFYGE